MKNVVLTLVLALLALESFAQGTIQKTAGITYTKGAPTWLPSEKTSSEISIDTFTGYLYQWHRTTDSWLRIGQGVDEITGSIPPAYEPLRNQSWFSINASDELYRYSGTGTTWNCLNCGSSGSTNLSFSGGASPYSLNSSTGSDVTFSEGANVTLTRVGNNLEIAATGGGGTVTTDATLDGDGTGGDPLGIAQQGAVSGQQLAWTGATWEPSWGNPYIFVTSGASITSAVNEVLVGTVSGDVVMGLPTCNAGLDTKHFKFVRNGTDGFSMTIDPASTQMFYDGTSLKILYGKTSIDCTCRFSAGVGTWFFDNF